ncbi:hypothetical protein SB18R_03125 [Pseudomonas oryzihabitans]|nr:hypothetical protein SB9_12360 [Pseudomonas psychrotolerans]KTT78240.1 hypothetical protein SB18R_03125 [Pseudomonas psychrotolerans]
MLGNYIAVVLWYIYLYLGCRRFKDVGFFLSATTCCENYQLSTQLMEGEDSFKKIEYFHQYSKGKKCN